MSVKDRFFPDFQETIMRTCLTYMLFNDSNNVDLNTDDDFIPIHLSSFNDDCHPNIPYGSEYGYDSHISYALHKNIHFFTTHLFTGDTMPVNCNTQW